MGSLLDSYRFTQLFSLVNQYALFALVALPIGIFVIVNLQYKKQGINDDRQKGLKIILHYVRLVGTNLAVSAAALTIALLTTVRRDLGEIMRVTLSMLLGGALTAGFAVWLLNSKTNNSKFPQIGQLYNSVLAFTHLLAAVACFIILLAGIFQLGRYQAVTLIIAGGICLLFFGASAAYFMGQKFRETAPKAEPKEKAE